MSSHDVASVRSFTSAFEDLLTSACRIRKTHNIEPALTIGDFQGQIEEIVSYDHGSLQQNPAQKEHNRQAHYAAIETAFRNIFYDLLVSSRRFLSSVRTNV